MTKQDLIEAGFKEFPVPRYSHKYAGAAFQKRYRSKSGKTLYFISAYWYAPHEGYLDAKESFEAEISLYPKSSGDSWATYSLHGVSDKSVGWLESHVEKLHGCGMFEVDRHNND